MTTARDVIANMKLATWGERLGKNHAVAVLDALTEAGFAVVPVGHIDDYPDDLGGNIRALLDMLAADLPSDDNAYLSRLYREARIHSREFLAAAQESGE